jgi:diguanylate cyclase (GGDEF)-like protein
LLETVGLQAAVALQNASLYEETRRRMEEMESLYGISTALSQNLDLESVMKNLLENCRQVLPIDAFYVALYDEESHMVSHPLFWDKGKFVTTAVRDIRLTPGLSGEVILSRKTLQLPDVLNPDTREKYQIIHLGGKPTRCYVGVPMITHDRIIGVISMQTYEPDSYTSEQIRLLEMIAHQAAVAIENSRLYRHAQEELALRRVTQRSLEKEKETLQVQLTQVEALQDELREQAIHDPLTGLYNRRYLDEMLNGLLNYARIYDKPICVIMMDIDHFKKFNDTHSHLAGDQLLQSLADLLRSHTRPTDITCRYGGEEFILVLPDTNLEIAGRRAEELRKAFEVMVINFQGKNLQATISMGIASFPEHGNTVEELTMQADQALYAAKTAGRNRVVIWRK